MALIVEARPADGPGAGVIEEARRRQRRRRAAAVAFGAVAAIVAGGLWLSVGDGSDGAGTAGAGTAGVRARPLKLALVRGEALVGDQPALMGVAPSLQAGNVGVCVRVVNGESCDGPPPTVADPVFGGEGGETVEEKVGAAGEIDALFVGPGVAAVRVAHVGTFAAQHAAGLPAQAKEVVFYRAPGSRGSVLEPGISPDVLRGFEHGRRGPALTETLLDAAGHTIPVRRGATFTLPNSYWRGSEAPPARGRCAMRSSLAGASMQWGQVADAIAAERGITVPAWLTCLHEWYSAGASALETAILLNASAPGRTPAPLWGAVPVPGHAGIVEIPPMQREIHFRIPTPSRAVLARELARDTERSGRAHALTLIRQVERAASKRGEVFWDVFVPPTVARRVGPAWLLVRYGDSLAQRIAFLDSLHVTRMELRRG
jgi:hypothetical protein